MERRNLFVLVIIVICSFSCKNSKRPDDCFVYIGGIFFETSRIEWGQIQVGKRYNKLIKVYNPNSQDITFTFNEIIPYVEIKQAHDNRDREFRDILIPAHSCDSLLIILTAPDSIGYFSKNIHIKVNTEIYLKPIELFAIVIESFENQDIEKTPTLEVKYDIFCFDTLSQKNKIEASFPIKNTGNRDLIIRKVETTCTCTYCSLTKNVIKPGESVVLEVIFNPANRFGVQYKYVRIFSNDPKRPLLEFTIKGFVKE